MLAEIQFNAGAIGLPDGIQGEMLMDDGNGNPVDCCMIPERKDVDHEFLMAQARAMAHNAGMGLNETQASDEIAEWLNE